MSRTIFAMAAGLTAPGYGCAAVRAAFVERLTDALHGDRADGWVA